MLGQGAGLLWTTHRRGHLPSFQPTFTGLGSRLPASWAATLPLCQDRPLSPGQANRACNSRGERSCGRLSCSSLNWENLPSLTRLCIPRGGEEQWLLHSANEAGGWEWGTGAVFHRWLYWPHGAQCGDNKNFLLCSSLFVISKRSRSSAGVTLSGTRCALTRCLNIYFSELWWMFFFQPSQYSDQCPTLTLLLSVAQFHGADLVFFSNCKILFKTNQPHSLVCLWFVLLPRKTFLED